MIPAQFTYQRAGSVDEALELAAEGGEDAKFLAGGHSLLPLMKLRLAVPEILIDIGRLRELRYVRDDGDHVAVGALSTHNDLATSGLLTRELPLLAHAAGQVGDPQGRHCGTIGGSLAPPDSAAAPAAGGPAPGRRGADRRPAPPGRPGRGAGGRAPGRGTRGRRAPPRGPPPRTPRSVEKWSPDAAPTAPGDHISCDGAYENRPIGPSMGCVGRPVLVGVMGRGAGRAGAVNGRGAGRRGCSGRPAGPRSPD